MSLRNSLFMLALTASMAILVGCETYPHHGEVRVHERDYDVRVVFSDRDRALIRDYYAPRYRDRGLPPGLDKKGKVPPGHAKKLYRGAPIPHDYRWQAMPHDLEHRLSRLPEGYARIIVGADIGIMNVRTRVVVDLLEDMAD